MTIDGAGGERWTQVGRRELLDCRIFRVAERENRAPDGRSGRFTVLDAPDWATVVPVLRRGGEDCFLMVRQYRHGSDEVCIEFPGGVVEPGEESATAAARELEEETGYRAGSLRSAGSVSPNPAFMANRFHVFVAEDLRESGTRSLDEHEIVDFFPVPVREVRAAMGTRGYSHALMVAALFMAERLLGGPVSVGRAADGRVT
ncbi:MAG: NUDIX hydrolase [Treponema sp.]|nr:NUDIX hydrolase [Treponema sp.]